ncbi:hypothetical protein HUT16_29215 [Kitasatospora sp. NA04385]|uniref:VanZ family protein n=1 Tax=Kitasatospora sp. NA04385 TaxID=2742135 RepID=UPI0015906A27|nr:VanZ family protein [Kitasatospora sp. NA04385]QKW22625.1 hypothetical protein HUT16_29215 [Kitasatospora sp. NA04385]
MIRAALNGNTGMIPAFLVLALLLGAVGHRLARRHGLPLLPTLLLAAALAGELAVTLYPTFSGGGTQAVCGWSDDLALAFRTEQGRLNLLMYAPIGLFGVLALGRPLAVSCGVLGLTAATETAQGLIPAVGRACDSSDLAANAAGGLLGVLLGVVVRLALRRRVAPDRAEWRAAGLLVAAVGVPVLLLQSFVLTWTGTTGAVEATPEQEQLARQDVALLFGPDAGAFRTQRWTGEGVDQLVVDLDKGTFTVDWPSGRLRTLMTVPDRPGVERPAAPATEAAAAAQAVRGAADAFAARWLPGRGAGTEPRVVPGGGRDGSHRFTYGTGADELSVDIASDGRLVQFGTMP